MVFEKDGIFKKSVYNEIIKKKDKNHMKKRTLWLLPLIAALLILCLACGFGNDKQPDGDRQNGTANVPDISGIEEISIVTPEPDPHRDELDAILKRITMLEGVTINGVNVGGMTSEEAKAAVQPSLDALQKDLKVEVTLGDETQTFSGETIATDSDLDEAIAQAFALVRDDVGFDSVSREVERIKNEGLDFPVRLTFNETALQNAVNAFADAHETEPQNASVSYNKDENDIDFTADVPGRTVNREALFSALLDAEGGETLEAPFTEVPAEITLKDIQARYVMRGTQTTNYAYSGSTKNRRKNIEKGAKILTGTILHPDEEFSMNDCLGVRNKANGWYLAGAYQSGDTVQEYGGGVCQISTTLYNAALKADMTITDRRNHSMPVHYISMGLDATINSVGNKIDFKFKNSSKEDILIIARTDGKNLTVEIWGIPIIEDSDGKYDEIRIPDTKKLKTLKPTGEKETIVDPTKPVGYRKEDKKRRDGSVWQSYIEYYLNGVLIEGGRKELATSTYKAFSGSIIVGPDADETTKPDATPKPDDPDPTPDLPDPTPDEPDPTPNEPDPTPNEPDPTPHEPDPTQPDEPDPPQPGDGDDG